MRRQEKPGQGSEQACLFRRFVFILFFLMVFFFSFFCFGQSFMVHQYSETDGLPGSVVNDVIQDRQGRMWFAARSGIAVYDGVSWEKHDISTGLPTLSIAKIRVDQGGRIWALGKSGPCRIQVAYYDPGSSPPSPGAGPAWNTINDLEIPGCKTLSVTSLQLIEQPNGSTPIIAVGTREQGLFLWNRGNPGKWENISEQDGLLSHWVNGIAFLEGKLYAATENGLSVLIINFGSTGKPVIDNRLNRTLGLPAAVIKGIGIEYKDKYPDSRLPCSRVWLFGHAWLGYFEASESRPGVKIAAVYPVETLLRDKEREVNILPDYRSGLYVGNHYELNYFNHRTRSWKRLGVNHDLIGAGANAVYIDFEKNIWIACDRGVSKIASQRFSSFQWRHGLLEDEVTAVLEVEPGLFVLGHNDGITFYDMNKNVFQPMRFPRKRLIEHGICRVLEMHADSKKNIWLALSWAGLAKITPQRDIVWYGREKGLPNHILCLWIDEQDNIWVGAEKEIFYRTGKENKFVPLKVVNSPGFLPKRIYGFAGKLRYIATHESGVYVYDHRNRQWKHHRVSGDLKANNVYAIKKDSRGRLFIGTQNGLYILEKENLKKFKAHDFQVDRPVYFILEDNRHRLWFGTDNGVVRWDGKTERKYSPNDGLIGHETNRAAAIQDSRGRIWFGTNRGVSIYDQAFENNESFKPRPKIYLLNLEAGGKSIPLDRTPNKAIRLSHNDNTLVFHFRGISFSDETAVRFQNKLEGFEEKWSEEHYPYKQMIRYTSLPPGAYRFHLKARNTLGVWSPEVTSPEIIIRLPFNRTWWFFLGISFLVGFILYGIFRFFSARRQAALLEKEVEKRTDQLQAVEQQLIQAQKMEAIGTLAGGIAHDFNNILAMILGYTELVIEDLPKGSQTLQNAKQVLSAADRAADLVKQILAFSRQSKQERKPLKLSLIIKEALKLLRSTLPSTIEICREIRVNSGADIVLANATQVHQILMNLAANAAHAMQEKGGRLVVSLDNVMIEADAASNPDAKTSNIYKNLKPGPYLRLTVSDTGQGISADVMKRIFDPFFTTKEPGEGTGMGLAVVHGIVKSHGGDISVSSKPGKGTTFQVYLPQIGIEGKK